MFRPIKWSSSVPSQRVTESQKAAHTCGIPLVFTSGLIGTFYFYSLVLPVSPLVNTNGIPYVCAAFCDSVTLCDGPDDDHLIGRNMLSIWHFYGNKRILLCWCITFYITCSSCWDTQAYCGVEWYDAVWCMPKFLKNMSLLSSGENCYCLEAEQQ